MAEVNIGGNFAAMHKYANLDKRYGPYNFVAEAESATGSKAKAGMTVGITGDDGRVSEYWWQPGGEDALELVPKESNASKISMVNGKLKVQSGGETFYFDPAVLTKAAVSIFKNGSKIHANSLTPGAQIHYTTDGSIPDSSSMLAEDGEIDIPSGVSAQTPITIKVVAISDGFLNSDIASRTVTETTSVDDVLGRTEGVSENGKIEF